MHNKNCLLKQTHDNKEFVAITMDILQLYTKNRIVIKLFIQYIELIESLTMRIS